MDWRYWITYGGKFTSDTEDEDVLRMEAMQVHLAAITEPGHLHAPHVEVEEVEPLEGGEGA